MMPPCKKNDTDCPLRRAGCQSTCEAFRAYKQEREENKKELNKRREFMGFITDSGRARKARKYKKSIGKG